MVSSGFFGMVSIKKAELGSYERRRNYLIRYLFPNSAFVKLYLNSGPRGAQLPGFLTAPGGFPDTDCEFGAINPETQMALESIETFTAPTLDRYPTHKVFPLSFEQ